MGLRYNGGVRMFRSLPRYIDFQGFDLENGDDLATTSKRFYGSLYKPPMQTRRHHLFNILIQAKLFMVIIEISLPEKRDGFKQERILYVVAKIPRSVNSHELVALGFVDYGDQETSRQMQDKYSMYSIVFIGTKRKTNKRLIRCRMRF